MKPFELKKLLDQLIEDEFNDLVFYHFINIYDRFSAGMTLTKKKRIFLEIIEKSNQSQNVIDHIQREYPERYTYFVQKNQSVDARQTREVNDTNHHTNNLLPLIVIVGLIALVFGIYIANQSFLGLVDDTTENQEEWIVSKRYKLGNVKQRDKDEMAIVYVPAGSFQMGTIIADRDRNEKPAHLVTISDGFWVDQYEVTNEQYALFLNEVGNQAHEGIPWLDVEREGRLIIYDGKRFEIRENAESRPAVHMSWYGANAYCEWVGGQLPTEAQWEYAARGNSNNLYPWGNEFDGTLVNFCDVKCNNSWRDESANDGFASSSPVGSYPNGQSWVGALDMSGNIWEFTADWFSAYTDNPQVDPSGSQSGTQKIVKGGSASDRSGQMQGSTRGSIDSQKHSGNIGFRCIVPMDR